jgi:peptidoglycan/LPS O-acetylase OafA/YrhL
MNGRIAYLDGIRIVSSIIVFMAHACQIFLVPKLGAGSITQFVAGQLASYSVVIFFMLSGYMVTNSIFNNNAKNGNFSIKKYWKDRLFRLYPPLIFAILLSIFIYLIIKFFHMHGSISFKLPGDLELARDSIQYSFAEIMQSLFFLQGLINYSMFMNGPLWSLGDEFFLYLVASCVAIIFFNKSKIIPFIIIILFFSTVFESGHLKTSAYLYFMWGVGACFSIVQNRLNVFFTKKINLGVFIALFTMILSILILKRFKIPTVNYEFLSYFSIVQSSTLLLIIFSFRSISSNWQYKIEKIFEKITPKKDFTYTLYVIHFPILLFCFSVFHVWLNKMPIYTTISILMVIIPVIILLASMLAKHLENKKRIEELYLSLKDQLNIIFYKNV